MTHERYNKTSFVTHAYGHKTIDSRFSIFLYNLPAEQLRRHMNCPLIFVTLRISNHYIKVFLENLIVSTGMVAEVLIQLLLAFGLKKKQFSVCTTVRNGCLLTQQNRNRFSQMKRANDLTNYI